MESYDFLIVNVSDDKGYDKIKTFVCLLIWMFEDGQLSVDLNVWRWSAVCWFECLKMVSCLLIWMFEDGQLSVDLNVWRWSAVKDPFYATDQQALNLEPIDH